MYLNEQHIRVSEEHLKDLRREANRERQANESRREEQTRKPVRNSPIWARVWILFF